MKSRIEACAKIIGKYGCDAFLVKDKESIYYLTGLKQENGYLLISAKKNIILFTNFIYYQEAQKIKSCKIISSNFKKNIFVLIANESKRLGLKKIGFCPKDILLAEYEILKKILLARKSKLIPSENLVLNQRIVKSKSEIERIKESIDISLESFSFAQKIFTNGMTEKNLSIEIEKFLRLKGDSEIAFPTIVASGKNAAFPHHEPKDTPIAKNFALIDLGAKCYGYCTDLTRMLFWGKMPPLLRKIHDVIQKAQDLSFKKVKSGATAAEIDKAARDFIDKKGWGKYFGHGLGHGVGLSVHEPPFINPNNKNILKEGTVITIEPAIYLNNRFGVRLEDMVLVKKDKGELLSGNFNR